MPEGNMLDKMVAAATGIKPEPQKPAIKREFNPPNIARRNALKRNRRRMEKAGRKLNRRTKGRSKKR